MINDALQVEIRNRLVNRGRTLLDAPKESVQFTKDAVADMLLNDLDHNPHALVLACVMDRQITAERAWLIPHKMSLRIKGFSMEILRSLSQTEFITFMREPEPLHHFWDKMGKVFHAAVQRIYKVYGGDASLIWKAGPSSAEVVYQFLQFDGVGPKIATMAANILARDFKIEMKDYYSIDISVDVHVRRVFERLGFCPGDATIEQIVYKARSMNPEFPGIMDLPVWEIGRTWCKPNGPKCGGCFLNDLCPQATAT